MTQKLLISTDRNGIAEFQKSVQGTAEAANQLIQVYEAFQPWEKITTIEAFMELVADPKRAYDNAIIANIGVTAKGMKVDPEQAARLFNLAYDQYLNLVSGLPLTDTECVPCKKVHVKPGKRAISKHEFSAYREWLTFDAGTFTVNTEAVDSSLDRFNTYAETPAEIERYALFNDLVQMLNRWDAVYPLSGSDKLEVKKIFGLHLSRGGEGDFMINPITLTKAVQSIKYQ